MKIKTLLISTLLTFFCIGNSFAQEASKVEWQCKIKATSDLYGGKITIIEKTGIREILNIITQKYGCKFIVDKEVTQIVFSVNVTDIPWFILLQTLLKSQNLAIQKNESIWRVAKVETLEEEKKWQPLVNEFVKLSYIPNQTSLDKKTLLKIINHRLTSRGSVELDEFSNTLKLTDVRENLNVIKDLIEIIDVKVNVENYLEQTKNVKKTQK